MNPLTNVKNINKLNQKELELGLTSKKSWHDQYKDSAWVFVGGLPYDLTEGDVVCVFSQYGEIVNINLVRDQKSGKSKGFCFVCFEDQRSTVLSVDNLNGIKLLGRTIRVDHVENYKVPKEHGDEDEETKRLRMEGCAPKTPTPETEKDGEKKKIDKKKKKEKRKSDNDSIDSDAPKGQTITNKKNKAESLMSPDSKAKRKKHEMSARSDMKIKTEKHDPGYEKALDNRGVDPVDSKKRRVSLSSSESDSSINERDRKIKRDRESLLTEKGSEDREMHHKYDNFNLRDRIRYSSKDKGSSEMSDRSARGKHDARDDSYLKDPHDKQRDRRERSMDSEEMDQNKNSDIRGDNSRYPEESRRRHEYNPDVEYSRGDRDGRYRERDNYYRKDDRYKRDDDRWDRNRYYNRYKK
ncbi:hypothetical protein CHS0354_021445 [Potamilus streckersoni]|uniref:RNA-binding motif protein, X-linked 2 n=1 Tax=Potamilus streckersoni TaxID=2493646 RepID=A0AAE0VP00_9BIVA|nr:hypothetical protein CHS0354_021445 [Potamilus streckersoni]